MTTETGMYAESRHPDDVLGTVTPDEVSDYGMSDHLVPFARQHLPDEPVEPEPGGRGRAIALGVSNAGPADTAPPDGDYRVRVMLSNGHSTSGGSGPGEVTCWRSEVEGLLASRYATVIERLPDAEDGGAEVSSAPAPSQPETAGML